MTRLPLRESPEIQGDILAGFRKDHVTILFLKFEDVHQARIWLGHLLPKIATTRQVAAFNAAYSRARRVSGGDDPKGLKAVWHGLSLTYPGMKLLAGKDPLPSTARGAGSKTMVAFKEGAARRGPGIGDKGASAPDNWLFGNSTGRDIHAVLTVAADSPTALVNAVSEQRNAAARARAVIVFEQVGVDLPGTRSGHEHFGFKDGVSHPGIRGFDEADNNDHVVGKPGTRVIPAGEIVIGYERSNRKGKDELPHWATDGSFHVVRRLAQDVPGWWAQLKLQLKALKDAKAAPENATEEWLAARMVGRWRSGTPVARCPHADEPFEAGDYADNDISYSKDLDGTTTPVFSHLRKTNPRDGLRAEAGKKPLKEEEHVDNRRLMRRGIPYGPPFDPAAGDGCGPDTPRGLVFASYQADLVEQFEFVQQSWINNAHFPPDSPEQDQPGADPMVGPTTKVFFKSESGNGGAPKTTKLSFGQFVRTEGSVYAFAPSLSTLRDLAQGDLAT